MKAVVPLFFLLLVLLSCQSREPGEEESVLRISGIYPHLAFYNEGGECGTGALVPWQGDLWAITYSPHSPHGSSDKLYQITSGPELIVREESIGGTPANRMIHRESGQLFIGPYAIDSARLVRVIPYEEMTGRHTGNARHLSDPENKIYYATMEEGFYEVDVHSLEVTSIVPDAHLLDEEDYGRFLPGAHGKGLYSGQGVLVYSNNGEPGEKAKSHFDIEAGALVEWNGADWKLVRRNQFTEVTGPGGIFGNSHPDYDPIWTCGWDHKSLILGVRMPAEGWTFYRLPKASHSYDGAHGWNTEWPRIRDIGSPEKAEYLMTMHGMFWQFPGTFSPEKSVGIRPRSAYLKVIGDFCPWKGELVLGCDDSAQREFLNKRKVKGQIEGPGQSNSNLWFIDPQKLDSLGPPDASASLWMDEEAKAGRPSEPLLFSGWERRACWICNHSAESLDILFEIDRYGRDECEELLTLTLAGGQARLHHFSADIPGEWIRARTRKDARLSLHFVYGARDERTRMADPIFKGLAPSRKKEVWGGLLYGLGDDQRKLGLAAESYYELTENLELIPVDDPQRFAFIRESFAIPRDVLQIDSSSVLIVDDRGRRWRLPLGSYHFTNLTQEGLLRISREVATERDLFSCHGTFYELPAENADGFAKIRPVASHDFRIQDYASYRGLLIMTGIDPDTEADHPHIIRSEDGKAALWAGVIDDLWKLGKPVGRGGPWYRTAVEKNEVSDPYLIACYDRKSLELFHDADHPVEFDIEVDPAGTGHWMRYKTLRVKPGEVHKQVFPDHFQARWIRFRSSEKTRVTAWLKYD